MNLPTQMVVFILSCHIHDFLTPGYCVKYWEFSGACVKDPGCSVGIHDCVVSMIPDSITMAYQLGYNYLDNLTFPLFTIGVTVKSFPHCHMTRHIP